MGGGGGGGGGEVSHSETLMRTRIASYASRGRISLCDARIREKMNLTQNTGDNITNVNGKTNQPGGGESHRKENEYDTQYR